jgi:hypothetical protein
LAGDSSPVFEAATEGAMKNGLAIHSAQQEYFVLQIDGRTKSGHRRFIDALRAGLQLKDQFPQRDIKVRAMQTTTDALEESVQQTVLH